MTVCVALQDDVPRRRFAPADRSLHAGFLRHAHQAPDSIALTLGARAVSYGELADTAARWAHRLTDLAGGRPARVGVFATRNETAFAGTLASLLAGAAFVPLNRRFPAERTRAMVREADLDAIIVDAESLPQAQAIAGDLHRVPPLLTTAARAGDLRDRWPARVIGQQELRDAPPLRAVPAVQPDDPAYLLFTSGSTGRPKGVLITHGNIRAFLDINLARYRLTVDDRLSQTFEPTFDLSMFDMFMAWESGARVCALEPIHLLSPARMVARLGLTVWFSVPSVAALLYSRGALTAGCFPSLRWSLFCGEGLPQPVAEAWQAAAPDAVLENLYGPTELTVACAAYRWDPQRSPAACVLGLVPIGDVYPGLPYRIVDETLADVTAGMAGELCVAGPQTSPGYWHAPEITAERFVELPEAVGGTQRYYRTGDQVMRSNGSLVFLGRSDSQIKIGGYRVELGEIEAVLLRAGCAQAAALAWRATDQPTSIVAIVTAPADIGHLRECLERALPPYMLPAEIELIDEMPLNANGKMDRGAIRGWLAHRRQTSDAAPPADRPPGNPPPGERK